tara:strand:+ start:241 stop:384 length:144 start_codon:yes stop_codon:yes gene_type:complete
MGVYADMELDRIVFDGLPPVEEKKKSDEDKHRNNKGLANQSKGKKNG